LDSCSKPKVTPEFIVADRVLLVEEKRHLLHEATGHGANLAPGYVHYDFSQGPEMARVIAAYLERPTSGATQRSP
jgi:hypothetical protein